ncbi:MAG: 2-dehydropantoate 2-reductase [Acidobacteria bacterium]|nr:2-dehydropantoate 2-reductase [Acidobacteriota bacterium]
MKFAIFGAGAIGAFVGARLAAAGEEVALIARGAHGQAMRARGVTVRSPQGDFVARPAVAEDPAEVGPADAVFLAVKAHSLPAAAERVGPLLGPETPVVFAQNGIPWWYFLRHGGEWEGTRLESVDPGGRIAAAIEARRVIGCVVYCSTSVAEPGVIEHIEGNRFAIGELEGGVSDRCRRIAEAFQRAGLKCPIRTRIRHDLWVKAIGNAAVNPISALTRAPLGEILENRETRALVRQVMEESAAVAARLGVELDISIEQRLAGVGAIGEHKTSMLQDLEAGRPLELEAITGVLVELADKLGMALPATRAVYACTKLLAQSVLPTG